MRIISGRYKGRLIHMPSGIRPTQQKVRKALFDILGDMEGLSFLELFAGSAAVGFEAKSYGAKEVFLVENNTRCLEAIRKNIFLLGDSGYQVIGLDAGEAIKKLNRAGKSFDIIFMDPPYYKEGRHLALSDGKCATFCGGVPLSAATPRAKQAPGPDRNWASVPSRGNCAGVLLSGVTPRANRNCAGVLLSAAKKTLQTLEGYDILTPNGIMVVQHSRKDILPGALGVLHLFRQSQYGDTLLSFYRKQ